nr:M56 family metallopeptidase [uncultured Dyadobacter sp.]
MSLFPDYLLKLSLSFALIALFYHFVLRNLTFYQWNRWYLLLYTALCFAVPFIDLGDTVRAYPQDAPAYAILHSIPTMNSALAPTVGRAESIQYFQPNNTKDISHWLVIGWMGGMFVMTCRLALHIISLLRIRSKSKLVSNDGVRLYHFDDDTPPFSFGNSIFYNPHLHEPDELQDMILHEYVHVRQGHTFDVIWSELLCIVNWFNPFVWLISHSVRQNLEYIADAGVLENRADAKNYQYLLLKTAMGPAFRMANHFGFVSLKQRIVMMNKASSPRIMLSCFLFVVPLLAMLLVAFRQESPDASKSKKTGMIWVGQASRSKRAPKDHLHLSGLLLDAKTGKPVANLPLTLSRDDVPFEIVHTDSDGYFFVQIPTIGDPKTIHSAQLSYDGPDFLPFRIGKSYQSGRAHADGFEICFLPGKTASDHSFYQYSVASDIFYDSYEPKNVQAALKSYLYKSLPPFRAESRLKAEFIESKIWPKDVITLYKTGYFDRNKELIGYVGKTRLYLDGKKATYRQVNEAFKNYPYMLTEAQERREPIFGVGSKITYLTFPLHRDAPPVAIVKGNAEVIDAKGFDLNTLRSEPYFLDGFRQVNGVGSNLMPLRKDIKRVVLLKGKLARYYDRALDRIWWIETRPVAEVFERPDFTAN